MRKKSKKYRVGRSSAGLGLFAEKEFAKGEFVIEYTGEKLSAEEAEKKGGLYLFEVDENLTLDATDRRHTARYLNHSCRPNCEAVIEGKRVKIYAKRKILPGEELTYNYGKEYFNDIIKPKGCRCQKCAEK